MTYPTEFQGWMGCITMSATRKRTVVVVEEARES